MALRNKARYHSADMPILLQSVPLGLDQPESEISDVLAARLRLPARAIRSFAVVRRSIDARRNDVHFVYHIELALEGGEKAEQQCISRTRGASASFLSRKVEEPIEFGTEPLVERPVIVGFGPGGMFAALRLAELGYKPIVLERGRDVKRRHRDILQRFYREGEFDPTSNLLFGEGGAGTYSDGKLYTRLSDPLCRRVLEVLYHHGADPDVLINARPHVGSDRLPTICSRIRQRIESLGGEVRFECILDDIRVKDGRLSAVHVSSSEAARQDEWIDVGPVILGIGHSARDTLRMLHSRGVRVIPKPFQIGVRIEHPQSMVDRWQYGPAAGHLRLGAAEYHAVAKGAASEHGDVFSFCMCPGGIILPSNESPGLIVTNGASRSARSGELANSGLVFTFDPQAAGMSAMEGLAYQERWEKLAFEATDRTYKVPVQRASDLLNGRMSDGDLETSYPLGGRWTEIASVVPDGVVQSLQKALPILEAKFSGFAGADALITAPETRASAPVRIERDRDSRQAVDVDGLYPVGEGAGYAGGIISAAVDGLKTAAALMRKFAPPH